MPLQPTLFLLRHAEKPTPAELGIDARGNPSRDSLNPRGWQRAGALVPFFLHPTPPLATPATLFATSPDAPGADPNATSRRNEQTAQPLANRLGLPLDLRFGKGQELEIARAAPLCPGPVLIVWTHRGLLRLLAALCPGIPVPERWPSHRFGLVLHLTPTPASAYTFTQIPQLLLAGDSPDLLALRPALQPSA